MAYRKDDMVQVLKPLKSLKGDYQGFAKHTNSKDIHTIINCCYRLLEDNFNLPVHKKKSIKLFLAPIKKEIKTLSNPKSSLKKKREILANPQVGHRIFTLLAGTVLPTIISALVKWKI